MSIGGLPGGLERGCPYRVGDVVADDEELVRAGLDGVRVRYGLAGCQDYRALAPLLDFPAVDQWVAVGLGPGLGVYVYPGGQDGYGGQPVLAGEGQVRVVGGYDVELVWS